MYGHIQREIEYTDNNPFDVLQNTKKDNHEEKGKQLEKCKQVENNLKESTKNWVTQVFCKIVLTEKGADKSVESENTNKSHEYNEDQIENIEDANNKKLTQVLENLNQENSTDKEATSIQHAQQENMTGGKCNCSVKGG